LTLADDSRLLLLAAYVPAAIRVLLLLSEIVDETDNGELSRTYKIKA
jgi:hypothetical protein